LSTWFEEGYLFYTNQVNQQTPCWSFEVIFKIIRIKFAGEDFYYQTQENYNKKTRCEPNKQWFSQLF
jgi:hypothetical protein